METPDITTAQIVAIAQALLGAVAAFGAPVTDAQSVALIALVAVIATVLMHADKGIRKSRNERVAAIEAPPAVTFVGSAETNPPTGAPADQAIG